MSDHTHAILEINALRAENAALRAKVETAQKPMTRRQIDTHIGPDEGDRDAVEAVVRDVEQFRSVIATPAAAPDAMQRAREVAADVTCDRCYDDGFKAGQAAAPDDARDAALREARKLLRYGGAASADRITAAISAIDAALAAKGTKT